MMLLCIINMQCNELSGSIQIHFRPTMAVHPIGFKKYATFWLGQLIYSLPKCPH